MLRTILIVDDVMSNRLILREMLRKDYGILEAVNGADALTILAGDYKHISAVLLDIGMPGMDGYEVLQKIRSDKKMSSVPVIMITSSSDENARVKSLSIGANDYVMKPYNSEVIKHCLQNNIAFHEAAATVTAMQRDKLTGLYAREAFFEKARLLIAEREPGHYVMSCIDIDNFKVINDQFGVETGDGVLVRLANNIENDCDADGSICGRISADNFAVLYEARLLEERAAIMDMHIDAIAEGSPLPFTVSIGRYLITDKTLAVSAMYDRAVIARKTIKGRSDVHIAVYDEAMRSRIIREQEIITEMRIALETEQFEVWFQPQYNRATGAMIGSEALVRWRHPQRGLIPPNDFIPLFEQNGFIYDMDKYVWEKVCRYLRKWLDEGRAPLPVSVNISRYDILRSDLIETITELVQKYDMPRDLLRLEVTESAFSQSANLIVKVVKELISLGFTVEIDDFGSGYSSLNTLKDVPAQIIKLDMKFLESSEDSQRGGSIVESVVRMAKWLGVSVIAEGVESAEQADYLRSIGCNYIQGYLYARPMAAGQYEEHCSGIGKEERLLTIETVENLDNNAFWNPESMDTLIFNSYVGAACIFEYTDGRIEVIRSTERFAQMIGGSALSIEDTLKMDWHNHLDADSKRNVKDAIEKSIITNADVTTEVTFTALPGCPEKIYIRATIRVIATAGNRCLIYNLVENITERREAQHAAQEASRRLQTIMDNAGTGIRAMIMSGDKVDYLFTNDRFFELQGYTRAQYKAEVPDAYAVIHPDDRALAKKTIQSTVHVGDNKRTEFRIITRDGITRWLRAAITVTSFEGVDCPVQLCVYTDITEIKENELRIRQLNENAQTLMNDTPGGFCRMAIHPNAAPTLLYLNDGFARMLGMTQDEVVASYGENMYLCLNGEDFAAASADTAAAFATGGSFATRCRLRHRDGKEIWTRVAGRFVTSETGEPILNSYFSDITAEITEQERQKQLLDNMPYGAALYSYDGGKLTAIHLNRKYWELVEREPEVYGKLSVAHAIHPDDRALIMHEIATAINEKRDINVNVRVLRKETGYMPFHVTANIKQTGSDEYLIYAAYAPMDPEALSYQQALPLLLSAVMGATNDFSFAKDKDFRYLCASPAFLRLAGLENERQAIGETDYELFPADMAEQFRQNDIALIESGKSLVDYEETIHAPDGTLHYCRASKYPLRDASGHIIGLYGVSRDITKEHGAFEQLQLINDSVPGGIATYSIKDDIVRIAYCNDGFCRLFGGTREGFLQRGEIDPIEWIHKDDLASLMVQIQALVEHNTPIDCVYRVKIIGGGYKWINEKAVATQRRGDTVFFNALLLDVNERQLINEQLRISEEENNLAVQHSGSLVCRYDVAERTLTMAALSAEKYDISPVLTDVPYEPVRLGLISPETANAYIGFFEAILKGNKAGTVLFQQKYLGKWQWEEAKSSTVFADDGTPVKAIISMSNVTDRIEKENIYKKWQQSLADRTPESYTLFRTNISHRSDYDTREGLLLSFDFDHAGEGAADVARAYAAACVYGEDRDKYIAFVNPDTMLANYYRETAPTILNIGRFFRMAECVGCAFPSILWNIPTQPTWKPT